MKCVSCGQGNAGARFCGSCGGTLVGSVSSPACSAVNLGDQRFCNAFSLRSARPPTPTASPKKREI